MTLFLLLLVFIGIAVSLAWFLIAHDHGSDEPVGALWVAAGLGFAGAIAAGALEGLVIAPKDLQPTSQLSVIALAALGIGVIEEACKFLPLAVWLWRKKYFNEHTDGVIYFALAGLGFGLPENMLYTLQFGSQAGIGRIILTPFFHAAITAGVGYFLAKRKLAGKRPWGAAIPLAGAALLHAFYDFGLSSGRAPYSLMAVFLTLGLSASLFVFYVRATGADQNLGLSAVGSNRFCRTCGMANPNRYLYCTACGKNA
jgi:RsiW-degrading membrane proteinase PrsW (M82 family)